MISSELKTIVDTLNQKKEEMRFIEAATEEQISTFEKKTGFTLPSQYREWLLCSDGGECYLPAGVQLYGVAHKPLINVEDKSRPDDSYVVIGALSNGDPILLKKDAKTVSIYNQGAGKIEDDEVYDDFFAFLNDLDNILGIGA